MKILLIKLNHLGDTLLLTPTLRMLRERFPEARIDVMVRGGGEAMLEGNPDVSTIVALARPEKSQRRWGEVARENARAAQAILGRRYDCAIDLSNSDRAKLWVLLSMARCRGINDACDDLGIKRRVFNRFSDYVWVKKHQVLKDFRTVCDVMGLEAPEPGPLRFFPQTDGSGLRGRFPALDAGRPFAVFHPTSRWPYKQWVPERWAQLADRLAARDSMEVIFSCGPDAREIAHVEAILGKASGAHFSTGGACSLDELGWLLGRASLFVGVDTVAMHLAAAMQTPGVALFGPTGARGWGPWKGRQQVVAGDCSCRETKERICDKSKTYLCMEQIAVEAVFEQALAAMAEARETLSSSMT